MARIRDYAFRMNVMAGRRWAKRVLSTACWSQAMLVYHWWNITRNIQRSHTPHMYNQLPTDVKEQQSTSSFKWHLKLHPFNAVNSDCQPTAQSHCGTVIQPSANLYH